MNRIIRTRPFLWGFVLGFLLFAFLNYYSLVKMYDVLCFHCVVGFGFPFIFVTTGGYVTQTNVIWLGLAGNIVAMVFASIVAGLALYFVTRRYLP